VRYGNVTGMSAMGHGYVLIGAYIITTVFGGVFPTFLLFYSKRKSVRRVSTITVFIILAIPLCYLGHALIFGK